LVLSADDPLHRSALPQKKTPGHKLRAQFQSSNFGTRTRAAESRQQKTTTSSFSWPSSCPCGQLCNPAHSLRRLISIPHPKRPDQRVESEAQIPDIAGRPWRRVFVGADDAVKQQRRFAGALHPDGQIGRRLFEVRMKARPTPGRLLHRAAEAPFVRCTPPHQAMLVSSPRLERIRQSRGLGPDGKRRLIDRAPRLTCVRPLSPSRFSARDRALGSFTQGGKRMPSGLGLGH